MRPHGSGLPPLRRSSFQAKGGATNLNSRKLSESIALCVCLVFTIKL